LPPVILAREYTLTLATGGFEESLTIRTPTGDKEAKATRVVCGMEESEWKRIEGKGSVEDFRAYLARYPHGRWRMDAKKVLEELAWQAAKRLDTLAGYQKFPWQEDNCDTRERGAP
jgi:hypothetical protein